MEQEKRIWGFHTLTEYDMICLNPKDSLIVIGWKNLGDLSSYKERDRLKEHYIACEPTASKSSVANCVGQIFRFLNEMQVGDYVVYPSKSNKVINIGLITSDYYFDTSVEESDMANRRKVKWLKHLPRTAFSQGALYELGAFLTVFSIKNYAEEFLLAIDKNFKGKEYGTDTDETVEVTTETIKQNTKTFILKELKKHYKGYDLEKVAEDLLKAMGYHTQRSPKGGDRGQDIIAYKDELPPRIVVQVKSQDSDIPEAMLFALAGAMKQGDYGLFIALSNYSKNAKDYLDQNPRIRGIDGEELVDLILRFYDKMSEEFHNVIKLEMVYLPK